MSDGRTLATEVDLFCSKIGRKWLSVSISYNKEGNILVTGRVNESTEDLLTVESKGAGLFSQRRVCGELVPEVRVVYWKEDILRVINNFKSFNMELFLYNSKLQSYSALFKDKRVEASSLNRYNEELESVRQKANIVLSSIEKYLKIQNVQGSQKVIIKDLSSIGQVCLIDCKSGNNTIQYRYKGNGVCEYRSFRGDEQLVSTNVNSQADIVRNLICDIYDNFPDLSKVVFERGSNTLQLYRENKEVYICNFGEKVVYEVKTINEEFIRLRRS